MARTLSAIVVILFLSLNIFAFQNGAGENIGGFNSADMGDFVTMLELMNTQVTTSPAALNADLDGNGWITVSDLFVAVNNVTATPMSSMQTFSAAHHIRVRLETVNLSAGIRRVVFSAEAPGNFTGVNIAVSFDNEIIAPVCSEDHEPFTPPTVAGPGAATPFRWLAVEPLMQSTMWDSANVDSRTVAMHGALVRSPANIHNMTDLFAFYFQVESLGHLTSDTFSIVDRSNPAYSNLLGAINAGAELNVGGQIWIWGHETHANTIGNITIDIAPPSGLTITANPHSRTIVGVVGQYAEFDFVMTGMPARQWFCIAYPHCVDLNCPAQPHTAQDASITISGLPPFIFPYGTVRTDDFGVGEGTLRLVLIDIGRSAHLEFEFGGVLFSSSK